MPFPISGPSHLPCPRAGTTCRGSLASPRALKTARLEVSRRGVPPANSARAPDSYLGKHFNFLSLKGGDPLPRSLKLGTSRSSVEGRQQDAPVPPPLPRPSRTRLTHPKVLMKPLTEPSAYRETISPMWRKLDISLMTAALREPGAVRALSGAWPGWVRRKKTPGQGGAPSRALCAAGAG